MPISTHTTDGVTVVEMDDGKANALTIGAIDDLLGVLADAGAASTPVVIAGRPGRFCAGYDLETIQSGDPARIAALLTAGRTLFREMLTTPVAVVAACTGHALAAGALLLLGADLRYAQAGEFRIGLNEVRIGMALPEFGVAVASHRLSVRAVTRAVVLGELVDPVGAQAFGFIDHVVDDDVIGAATDAAREIATLPADAVALTKQRRYAPLLAALDAVADA